MRNVVFLGLFVLAGIGATIYDAMILRPPKLLKRQKLLAQREMEKRNLIEYEDGFRPTPSAQVYDLAETSCNLN